MLQISMKPQYVQTHSNLILAQKICSVIVL